MTNVADSHLADTLLFGVRCNDALNRSKVTAKTFEKIYIAHKCWSFELSIYQRILKKYLTIFTEILSSTTALNIDDNNKKCYRAVNQHIRRISEGHLRLE